MSLSAVLDESAPYGVPGAAGEPGVAEASEPASPDQADVPLVDIAYYTDPICSWSWAFEPHLRRLRYELGDRLRISYHLGGMIPDWQSFSDPLNSVDRPSQMGSHWYQVRQHTAMPLDERIWVEDAPTSSYPASIAVKAAQLQGADQGESYLRRLRESVMSMRRNIAKREVLLAIADELAGEDRLDAARFERDFGSDAAVEAFREDLTDARYRDIGRFPTLIYRRTGRTPIITVGFRPYELVRDAVGYVAPDLEPVRRARSAAEYVAYWGRVSTAEVAVALGIDVDAARQRLDELVLAGMVERLDPDFYQPRIRE